MKNLFPRVLLHPQTLKHMKLGHPWVTEDSFTRKFPHAPFLVGMGTDKKETALLLHDENHKKIKARLWSLTPPFDISEETFKKEFQTRLKTAFGKRKNLIQENNRENYYLVFGESDFLPGIFLQRLKNHFVLGLYTQFWDQYLKDFIAPLLISELKLLFPDLAIELWAQERNKKQEKQILNLTHPDLKEAQFLLSEYEVNYLIKINNYYDLGIYTDMSALRPVVLKKFKEFQTTENARALNLFSYTGAYSLYFLKQGFKEVVSVDLSKKYLEWLEENLKHNPDLDVSKHHSLCLSVRESFKKLHDEKRQFDLIISDPPSASSDGEKMSSSLKFYEEDLKQLLSLLAPNGIAVLFLNTHTISRKKFEEKIQSLIASMNLQNEISIIKRVSLENDCPSLKGFIEGDYLKGLFVQKKATH